MTATLTRTDVRTTVVVVGGGPAGLAVSRHLRDAAIDHVVLERGRVAERWRSERWDSLRLLTPNWLTNLPGWAYDGDDPDGFMTTAEVIDRLERFARSFDAPVIEDTEVVRARTRGTGFEVTTRTATYRADALIAATGASPNVPAWWRALTPTLTQIHSSSYRNPAALPAGGVLVVGAAASGVQIAAELARAGRDVVLAVGDHVRLPRTYRGRDVHWWLDRAGVLEATTTQVADLDAARRSPSLALVGARAGRTLDLDHLQDLGVTLAGRATGAADTTVWFADDLVGSCATADRRLTRLLDRFDAVAVAAAIDRDLPSPTRPAPTRVPATPAELDLEQRGVGTVLWATGFRHVHPWLDVPVRDDDGAVRHDGGVTDVPGLYTMGLPFMRRRSSTFLDGIRQDAGEVVAHLLRHLDVSRPARSGSPSPGC